MELNTKYHGVKKYEEEEIITFAKGLPGFEMLKSFIVFPLEENDVFSILHSTEDENIGVIITSPFIIDKNYEINLEDNIVDALKIEKETDVIVVNTVTVSSKADNITVNLKAPIIINIKEKLGEQIILDNPNYLIKHPFMQE